MGFMSYTVNGSDSASDAAFVMANTIAKTLQKELLDQGNDYNTPGYINVCMIAVEQLAPGNIQSEKLYWVVNKARSMLLDSKFMPKNEKSKLEKKVLKYLNEFYPIDMD